MNITVFSPELLSGLINQARKSPRTRQHHNIHQDYLDPSQRFLNAIEPESYIRPHRHSLDPKAETLIAIKGQFGLVLFDDDGGVQKVIKLGSEKFGGNTGADLPPGTWHTIVALTPGAVLLELKAGPFRPDAAKELAPWAPEEGGDAAVRYLSNLRKIIDTFPKVDADASCTLTA
ncbi:WbuC family cupin fold metalloprotein [Massilia sp. R2A-15]|uniref:WbuC family cupin fold metalloprotein n=1 Tax=Massilia sp. R2A-15 TaxID=3064278 RepID=UPI00273535D4|nr:WbuC family cupin fold metalloprotein [Massilia sp. R2A-15]WLI88038.1 WbuC family cupin fold metalloprotein [Massilia sp. R2A-15]